MISNLFSMTHKQELWKTKCCQKELWVIMCLHLHAMQNKPSKLYGGGTEWCISVEAVMFQAVTIITGVSEVQLSCNCCKVKESQRQSMFGWLPIYLSRCTVWLELSPSLIFDCLEGGCIDYMTKWLTSEKGPNNPISSMKQRDTGMWCKPEQSLTNMVIYIRTYTHMYADLY